MNKKEFDKKYKKEGGLDALKRMFKELKSLRYIAKHFGVSHTRVSQWSVIKFGVKYDPRKVRKQLREKYGK